MESLIVDKLLQNIKERPTLVHCITNYVTANDVANVIIPTPVPSSDNTLSSLQVSAGAMDPEFNPDVLEYKLEVYNDVTTLYFNYKTSEHNATVLFIGNEELKEGDNKVKVAVTAQNGDVREYVLNVKRETT